MLTTEKTTGERIAELDVQIAGAQAVLLKFPFQTSIRQDIMTLKERKKELQKQQVAESATEQTSIPVPAFAN